MLRTFAIHTLGCKVNQYESRQIEALLTELGLEPVRTGEKPDVSIINTCCVTHTASAKSRQYIRKAKRLNCICVVVVGCLTRAPETELQGLLKSDNIYLIKNRSSVAAELSRIILTPPYRGAPKELQGLENPETSRDQNAHNSIIKAETGAKSKSKTRSKLPNLPDLTLNYKEPSQNLCAFSSLKLPRLKAYEGQTRAFLKAQDGCDSYCTYCIIPKVRAGLESRSISSLCGEAEELVKSGHKEIVITGICLGAFGRSTTHRSKWADDRSHLAELIDKLSSINGLQRLRVSSLNPQDITPQLLDVLAGRSNIMPHLHLSLQSGSDRILKRMARGYSRGDYLEKVRQLKERLEKPAITTDIIVGFPGETDEDFEETIALAEQAGFSRIHVFSFSERKGTAAAKMKPKVRPEIIKARASRMQAVADRLALEYREQLIGQTEEVLIENTADGFATGRAQRYFEVSIPNSRPRLRRNDIVEVRLTANNPAGMTGKAI